jgi:hypothetical protein
MTQLLFQDAHSLLLAFAFYAGLNVVALVMIFFLVPGTS